MIFSVEGNIGSGKSTFCNYIRENFTEYNLKDNRKIYFLDEPVSDWEGIKNSEGNLLENFYKYPDKYGFCLQMAAYISRLVKLKEILKVIESNDIIIMERSVFSDYMIFARMLYETNKINEIEYQVYKKWFYYFIEGVPDIIFIYIKTDFENCYNRVIKRGRKGENNISKEYLQTCEKYHEQWLNEKTSKIVLDGNKDTTYHKEYLNKIIVWCNGEQLKDNK